MKTLSRELKGPVVAYSLKHSVAAVPEVSDWMVSLSMDMEEGCWTAMSMQIVQAGFPGHDRNDTRVGDALRTLSWEGLDDSTS